MPYKGLGHIQIMHVNKQEQLHGVNGVGRGSRGKFDGDTSAVAAQFLMQAHNKKLPGLENDR